MAALPPGTGFGGAADSFFYRNRLLVLSVVLSLVGIATGLTTSAAVLQGVSIVEPLALGAGAVLAAACCLVQTRHGGLAAMAAAAPLPGLLWAAPFSAGSHYGAVPFLAYACGFAVAALAAQTAAERALDGRGREYPWRATAAALALMLVSAVLWFWMAEAGHAAVQAVIDTALSTGSALLLVPLGAAVLQFDESFVARANRMRERRQRRLERLAMVAAPRWSYSLTGIALVFAALGWFGHEDVARAGTAAFVLRFVSVALVMAAAGWFAQSWRDGAAAGLAAGTACLVGLWAVAEGRYGPLSPVGVLEAAAAGLLLILDGVRLAYLFRSADETAIVARQRSIEEAGAGQVFAAAGALLALLPAVAVWPAYAPFAVALFAAAVAAIVWTPAAATVLETMLPRHHSAEDLYGPRRK